jgi:hypothetical protein
MNTWVNLNALWKILLFGLLAGAGLPAVFAIGLRALASGPHAATAGTEDEHIVGGSPAGIAAATLCFAIVLAAIGYGIYFIVKGS